MKKKDKEEEVEDNKINFKEMERYYNIVLRYIQKDEMKLALKVLHNEMPVELYDASLDLLDNRNVDVKHVKLKQLVTIVDNLLNRESTDDYSYTSDIPDGFLDNIY